MTEKQKSEVIRMRKKGTSFSKISEITGVSRNTIKSFCRRKNITIQTQIQSEGTGDKIYCKECKAQLYPLPGRKTPKFCSAACRTKWWNSHPEEVKRRAIYSFTCAHCGKPFTAYGNKNRKFCSHSCYITARFKMNNTKCRRDVAEQQMS